MPRGRKGRTRSGSGSYATPASIHSMTGEGPPGAAARRGWSKGSGRLRGILVGLDGGIAAAIWAAVLAVGAGLGPALVGAALAALVTITTAGLLHLYRARVCSIRAEEKRRLVVVGVVTGFALGYAAAATTNLTTTTVVVTGIVVFAGLVFGRLCYHHWLKIARARGRYVRPIVVVGISEETADVLDLLETHPEIGLRVIGVVGDHDAAVQRGLESLWISDLGGLDAAVEGSGVNGALLVTSALRRADSRDALRRLHARGVHVHVAAGLMGLDHHRVRSLPLSHEPLFYVEARQADGWPLAVKRAIDVVVASLVLVVTAPLLAAIAICVKLGDRGPVIYRSVRVGRDGKPFTFLKIRTMTVGADRQLDAISESNERNGPLYKSVRDPRRTRLGRILEATSLDELPQLVNVLRGDMSLVGPRPALPHEVAQFDGELLDRHRMRPGITGLWQVEGRDNPSFSAYKRLDLFYLENWSLGLDLVVMFTTVQVVVARALTRLAHRPKVTVVDLAGAEALRTAVEPIDASAVPTTGGPVPAPSPLGPVTP